MSIVRGFALFIVPLALLAACAGKSESEPAANGGAGGGSGANPGTFPECPGFAPHGPPCRTQADCEAGSCNPWNVTGCVFTCAASSDCPDGSVCSHGCPHCEPACTASSCPKGFTCGADGRCDPIACNAGYECPVNTRCNASYPDEHGCSALACSADTDCDCGLCFEGRCAEGPGWCGGLPL